VPQRLGGQPAAARELPDREQPLDIHAVNGRALPRGKVNSGRRLTTFSLSRWAG
jgi:hypothetical protein